LSWQIWHIVAIRYDWIGVHHAITIAQSISQNTFIQQHIIASESIKFTPGIAMANSHKAHISKHVDNGRKRRATA